MKALHIVVLGGTFACSSAALADFPFDAGTLGRMKGILDTCSSASPQKASAYLLQMKSLIGDAKKAAVDEATGTEEYKQAYESIRSELGNMPPDEVSQACNGFLTSSK